MLAKEKNLDELKSELARLKEEVDRLERPSETQKAKVVKSLYRWQSFARPYARRGAKWLAYSALSVATIVIVLAFIREFFIIAPVLALFFVAYVLATVPPEIIQNEITTQGVNTASYSYLWNELEDFWFTEKNGFTLLHVDTLLYWPRRLVVLINKDDKEKIKEILVRYIPFRELPKTTWLDHAAEGLSRAFHKLVS